MALIPDISGRMSDTYGTLAELKAYAPEYSTVDISEVSDDNLEIYMRLAAINLDARANWRGKKYLREQARAWPREDKYYPRYGFYRDTEDRPFLQYNEIPENIKRAQFELALQIVSAGQTSEIFEEEQTGNVISESVSVAGVVATSTTYSSPQKAISLGEQLGLGNNPLVDSLIREYVKYGQNQARVIRG